MTDDVIFWSYMITDNILSFALSITAILVGCVLKWLEKRADFEDRIRERKNNHKIDTKYNKELQRIYDRDKLQKSIQDAHIVVTSLFSKERECLTSLEIYEQMSSWYRSMCSQCAEDASLRGIIFHTEELPTEFVETYETPQIRFINCQLGTYSPSDEQYFVYDEMNHIGEPKSVTLTKVNGVAINKSPSQLLLQFPKGTMFVGEHNGYYMEDDRRSSQSLWNRTEGSHLESYFRFCEDFKHQPIYQTGCCLSTLFPTFKLYVRNVCTFLLKVEANMWTRYHEIITNFMLFTLSRNPRLPTFHYISGYPFAKQSKHKSLSKKHTVNKPCISYV